MTDFSGMNIAESLKKDWDKKPAQKPMTICELLAERLDRAVEIIIALDARIVELETKRVKK